MRPEPNAETIRSLEEELANLTSLVEKMKSDHPSREQTAFIARMQETLAELKTRIETLKENVEENNWVVEHAKTNHDSLMEDSFRRQWGFILAFGGAIITLIFALVRR